MIDRFTAEDLWPPNRWFNSQLRQARRGVLLGTGPGIEQTGQGLSYQAAPRIFATVAGSGPSYTFAESVPNATGSFTALPGGRTDVGGKQLAWEINGVTGLNGTTQRLRFTTVDTWFFQVRRAGSGGGGGGGGTSPVPGCFCAEIPSILTMTSRSETCNFGMFQSCTIEYQTIPAAYAALDLGAMGFISNESFPDVMAGGALFQYMLTCQYNQFSLTRIYAEFPLISGPFQDALLYTWFVGSYGNSCDPFHLDDGAAYPGSDVTCFVTIDTP